MIPSFSNFDWVPKAILVLATTIPWLFSLFKLITPLFSLIAIIFQLLLLEFSTLKSLVAKPAEFLPSITIFFLFIKVCLLSSAFSDVNRSATWLFFFPWINPLFIPVTCISCLCVSGCTSIPAVFSASKYIFPLFSNENSGSSIPPASTWFLNFILSGNPGSNVTALLLDTSTIITVSFVVVKLPLLVMYSTIAFPLPVSALDNIYVLLSKSLFWCVIVVFWLLP